MALLKSCCSLLPDHLSSPQITTRASLALIECGGILDNDLILTFNVLMMVYPIQSRIVDRLGQDDVAQIVYNREGKDIDESEAHRLVIEKSVLAQIKQYLEALGFKEECREECRARTVAVFLLIQKQHLYDF